MFLLCTGPFTEQTVVDFWRMVWQVKSRRIVMLTCLTEDSKVRMLDLRASVKAARMTNASNT